MPTVSYDFDEAGDYADFVTLEPGNALFKFTNADATQTSKSGGKKVVVDLEVVATEKHNRVFIGGLVRQHWPTTGKGAGRFRDFLEALGVKPKGKGSLKLEKYYGEEIGAHCIKVAGRDLDEAGNPVWFNDLKTLKPGDQMRELLGLNGDGTDDDEDEDEEEVVEEEETEEEDDEEEEAEDEEGDDEDAEDEEEEEEEDEEEGVSWDDVMEMNLTDLKALAKELGVSTRPPKDKKLTVAVLRKRLEPQFVDEEEEGEEDPF